MREFDVIVIGMGPVGTCMALALAQEGMRVAAVEPALDPFDKPRAIGIDHESLRLFQRLGLMGEIEPTLGDYRPSEYRSASGEVLRRIIPQPEPHPQGWPPYSTFVQPELEAILRSACLREERVEMMLGWTAAPPRQFEDHVTVDIVNRETGETAALSGHFLFGCDGARSLVRESMGVALFDLEFDEKWLVVDIIVDGDVDLPEVTVQYCNASRPATFIAGPGKLRRWEIMLLPGEEGEEMAREEKVWRLLAPWLRPDQGRLWRAAAYRFHALVAERWDDGRLFLAGDAAHQTPPFMAQGLNQGFKDVANLAWKIGAVHAGRADASILQTYTQERQPNASAVIKLTKQLGKIICELDSDRANARDEAMLMEMRQGRGEIVRQSLLPSIEPGRLVLSCDRFGSGAGEVFPQPLVKNAEVTRRLDDLVPRGFVLFASDHIDGKLREMLAKEAIAYIDLKEGRTDNGGKIGAIAHDWLRDHGVLAALVRPDHVVFGTAVMETDIRDLVARLRAALALAERQNLAA